MIMIPSTPPVLVAGAGPSGLVAALTLLQNDVPVRIIDKEPHYRIAQRSNGVWPRTFEVFHFLRTFEIHQMATPLIPAREYKPGTLELGKTFSMFTPSDPTPSIPYSNPMFLGQPTIERILRSHVEKYGSSVELGTELESFEDDGERVLAKLVKRKDGQEVSEIFEASYLIGADGAKGITRKRLGLTFLGETRQDFSSVTGDICIEIEGVDRNHVHFFGNRPTNFFMLRPTDEIAPDGFQFLISLKDHAPEALVSDEKLMLKRMSELVGHEIKVRKVVFASVFRPNIRMADKFGHGRVFIVGDAAHVHSPSGGQGLNTSVQDALNIAWKLSLVNNGHSPTTLLDSYTTERLPVIAEMLDITTGILDKLRQAPTIEGAMEREERLNMLGVNYRMSPIVVDEFTNAKPVNSYRVLDESDLVAGDRAPDAPGLVVLSSGAETRLFDVFSPTYHTVLVFTPDTSTTSDILKVLRMYSGDVIRPLIILPEGFKEAALCQVDVIVDRDGYAYRAYLAAMAEQKVVVVRPDGVVGAIVHGAEGVGTYFNNIFRVDGHHACKT